jgi:hypothetical protein
MRLLRTEIFFRPEDVKRAVGFSVRQAPGISFLFVSDSERGFAPDISIDRVGDFVFQEVFRFSTGLNEQRVQAFIDLALRGSGAVVLRNFIDAGDALDRQEVENGAAVRAVCESTFVYQNSPPAEFKIADLANLGAGATGGIFLGVYGATLTVPVGIVLIGSAIGISRALEKGLQKKLDKLLK